MLPLHIALGPQIDPSQDGRGCPFGFAINNNKNNNCNNNYNHFCSPTVVVHLLSNFVSSTLIFKLL